MQVASLELCKELYKLSGWDDNTLWDCEYRNHPLEALNRVAIANDRGEYYWKDPRYDLGYLLRKLSPYLHDEDEEDRLYLDLRPTIKSNEWNASYETGCRHYYATTADTPENACAKLCLELFKANILKPEGKS